MIKQILTAALFGAAVATVALAQPPASPTVPPMPADTKPIRASGIGLRVSNLERSLKFYTEVLGMQVDLRVPATGPVREYMLGMTGDRTVDTLIVISQGEIVPGASGFGRIVLVVPSGRKMAERVKAAGYPVERIVDGTNIIKDPDGYTIELYQRPAAPAAAPAAPAARPK